MFITRKDTVFIVIAALIVIVSAAFNVANIQSDPYVEQNARWEILYEVQDPDESAYGPKTVALEFQNSDYQRPYQEIIRIHDFSDNFEEITPLGRITLDISKASKIEILIEPRNVKTILASYDGIGTKYIFN